jgi:hypothetical protein
VLEEIKEQRSNSPDDVEGLGRLRSREKSLLHIMEKENLFAEGSMENDWLRRETDSQTIMSALGRIQRPANAKLPQPSEPIRFRSSTVVDRVTPGP